MTQGSDPRSLAPCGLLGQACIAHGAIAKYLEAPNCLKITCTAGERLHAAPNPVIRSTAQAGG